MCERDDAVVEIVEEADEPGIGFVLLLHVQCRGQSAELRARLGVENAPHFAGK